MFFSEINLPVIEKKDAPSPPGSTPTPPDLASATTRAHPDDTSKPIINDDLQIVIIGEIKLLMIFSLVFWELKWNHYKINPFTTGAI